MTVSRLNFCFLALSVWLVSCYGFLTVKSLFKGRLKIAVVFVILTIALLISESLLGNAPVTMAVLQMCLDIISS